jgi:hypothetical protein
VREFSYRKTYEHDFDSIGVWYVFRWSRPTGVIYPWGMVWGHPGTPPAPRFPVVR